MGTREEITFVSGRGTDLPFFIEICGRSYCDGSYHINRPHSYVLCMEYVLEGEGSVSLDGRTMTAAAGDVYILPRGHLHDYRSGSAHPWKKIWFNASGDLTDGLLSGFGLSDVLIVHGSDALPYFEEILSVASSGLPTNEINEKASRIFDELCRHLHAFLPTEKPLPSAEAVRMHDYLERHLRETVLLEDLAGLFHRSTSQILRIFKKEYGITPYQYLLSVRFELSKTLLLNTGMRVRQIASEVGFSDEHYFSDLFHRRFGLTPMEYRQKGRMAK